MKYIFNTCVRSYDISQTWEMKLSVLAKILQEAAFLHSEQVGYDMSRLIEKGYAWVVYTFLMEIYRFPRYRENISVTTWVRRSRKFRAFREFEIHCGEEKLASIGGIGLFVNFRSKEVHYATHAALNEFEPEVDHALSADRYKWRIKGRFDADVEIDISTRLSDIDMLGHVNNSEYFAFLETAIFREYGGHAAIRQLNVQYLKEIEQSVGSIQCGLKKLATGCLFKIHDQNTTFAQGEVMVDFKDTETCKPQAIRTPGPYITDA